MSEKHISRADLEEAIEGFLGESVPNEQGVGSLLIFGSSVILGAAIFGIFLAGKRSGRLLSTVVEVRRS